MGIRTIIWAGFFGVACFAALWNPVWGIVGYIGHYSVGPEQQWWAGPINRLGLRYSFILAAVTAAGMMFNWGKLRFGSSVLNRHELLMLLFLGLVWLMTVLSPETVGRYTGPTDHPSVKLTKVYIFIFMMSHVVTYVQNLDRLLWVLCLGALVLGIQAWETPYSAFNKGRLEGVGGADFSDANRFAGYMGSMLFIIASQFMRSDWRGKMGAAVTWAFTANAVVLARSRGAFLGVIVGMLVALALAPKNYRSKVLVGIILLGSGGFYLSDPQFLDRVSTINESAEERDSSSQSRIEIWAGATKMVLANPLGVGVGNFYQNIGRYAPNHPGRDAHNTFVRCAGELGLPGLAVFSAIVISAFVTLHRTIKRAAELPGDETSRVMWASYGTICALTVMLTYGMTGTLVYTEYLWWMLAIPLCLERVLDNLVADQLEAEESLEDSEDEILKSDKWMGVL